MTTKTQKLSFNPRQITSEFLKGLNDRTQYVLTRRFNLDGKGGMTLESIGDEYSITRERVRQIENFGLQTIRKSKTYDQAKEIFNEIKNHINTLGGIVDEEELLKTLSDDKNDENHIYFYLNLGPGFTKHRETPFFKARWSTDNVHAEVVHTVMRDVYGGIAPNELLSEKELLDRIVMHDAVEKMQSDYKNRDIAMRWLAFTRALESNPLNEWGHANSSNVRVRGVRDFAYLVMRNHGSPMHFKEVAGMIEKMFNRKTHVATTHNELIKDDRFVLIGRGMYALKSWGYRTGVVRDVIQQILKDEGPLSREDIMKKVLKERYLKRNTIMVNLQNTDYFTLGEDGLYRNVK